MSTIVNANDIRGRKTQTRDPDLGLWRYEYNALGELVKQTDAKNQVSTMAYDKLGRMTQRIEPGLTSDWVWDTSPTRGKGKLYQAKTGAGYSRTHSYDDKGRPVQTWSNFGGTGDPLLIQTTAYDSAGRIFTQAYPSNFSVKHVYNALGYLAEIRRNNSANVLYWQLNAMDAEGHITKETYGNGVVTARSYTPQNGRLQNIGATPAGGAGGEIQSDGYFYDTLGNLSMRATDSGTDVFQYDDLNRLTQRASSSGIWDPDTISAERALSRRR